MKNKLLLGLTLSSFIFSVDAALYCKSNESYEDPNRKILDIKGAHLVENNNKNDIIKHIPQVSQIDDITCNATVVYQLVKYHRDRLNKCEFSNLDPLSYITPSIKEIYDKFNTDGPGMGVPELKNALSLKGWIYKGINIELKNTKINEDGYSEINNNTFNLIFNNLSNYDALIIYGNTVLNNGQASISGGHYYLLRGAKKNNNTIIVNDSIRGYSSYETKRKLFDYKGVSLESFKNYWGKTGSKLPWEKKHMYIAYSAYSPE